jgi:hypothetical protein
MEVSSEDLREVKQLLWTHIATLVPLAEQDAVRVRHPHPVLVPCAAARKSVGQRRLLGVCTGSGRCVGMHVQHIRTLLQLAVHACWPFERSRRRHTVQLKTLTLRVLSWTVSDRGCARPEEREYTIDARLAASHTHPYTYACSHSVGAHPRGAVERAPSSCRGRCGVRWAASGWTATPCCTRR